ncbi:hypothetical protein [Acetobacter pasteurianus]|nr:hypothetical protein [Acetobacter pasteurianus]
MTLSHGVVTGRHDGVMTGVMQSVIRVMTHGKRQKTAIFPFPGVFRLLRV